MGIGWVFKKIMSASKLLASSLHPCLSLSLSSSSSFFLNETLRDSKVYFESQVPLGVYQKEKLGMFKNNSFPAA